MGNTLCDEQPSGRMAFQADRGSRFTSAQLQDAALELNLLHSVRRAGVRWDNAMSESFWSIQRSEYYVRYR